MTTDKVLAALEGGGGTVVRTSFDETKEMALREAPIEAQALRSRSGGCHT
jgi:uncharacterized membrane protein